MFQTVKQLIEALQKMPQNAPVVVDERDMRGGYLWDITAIFPPDVEEGVHSQYVMIRCQEIHWPTIEY